MFSEAHLLGLMTLKMVLMFFGGHASTIGNLSHSCTVRFVYHPLCFGGGLCWNISAASTVRQLFSWETWTLDVVATIFESKWWVKLLGDDDDADGDVDDDDDDVDDDDDDDDDSNPSIFKKTC